MVRNARNGIMTTTLAPCGCNLLIITVRLPANTAGMPSANRFACLFNGFNGEAAWRGSFNEEAEVSHGW
jgi:hypothetical protein